MAETTSAPSLRDAAQALLDEYERVISWRDPNRHESADGHPVVVAMKAALASAEGEGWRPIETPPRGGTRVLVCARGVVGEAYFETRFGPGAWWWANTSNDGPYDHPVEGVTNWQPLPAPPTTPGGRTDG